MDARRFRLVRERRSGHHAARTLAGQPVRVLACSSIRTHTAASIVLLAARCVTPALAQHADPSLDDPSVAQQEAELASRRANPPTIMPAANPVVRTPIPGEPASGEIAPGLSAEDLGVPMGSLYAEGTFLVRRAGAMLQAPSGEWIYVFAPSPTGQFDTPMVLVPSAELEHVLPTISADSTPRPLVVTGQVLVYSGRNYLVPLAIADAPLQAMTPAGEAAQPAQPEPGASASNAGASQPPAAPDTPDATEASVAEPPTAEQMATDPDVASLIADLQSRRNVPRGLAPRAAETGTTRESLLTPTAIQTLPEGTMIVRRRARMVRETSGAWALALDNDAGQDATRLVILPCQNLSAMEKLAAGQAEEAEFEVTARVLTFQGRNYAMPLMFWLMRGTDVRALQ